jgi:hypothetical protein
MENGSESSMNDFDRLAELIAERWYGGNLPNCPTVIACIFLGTLTDFPAATPEILEAAKRNFADCLSMALRDRIAAQDADEKSQFLN